MLISTDLLDQIVDHAIRDAPDECCGFIWLQDNAAVEVVEVENLVHSPARFEVSPTDLLSLTEAGENGRSVVIYHSHTFSPPIPSTTDVAFAANWPGFEWLIVGVDDDGMIVVRNWRIEGDSVIEIEVVVQDQLQEKTA